MAVVKLAKGTPLYHLVPALLILIFVAICRCLPDPTQVIIPFLTLIFALSYLLFFRDPDRKICSEAICSPADGIVQFVNKNKNGWHIAVFMNVHNVRSI